MRLLSRLAFTVPLLLAACSDSTGTDVPTIETTTFAASLGVDLPASTRTSTGLYYRDLVVGTGATVTAGQTIAVRYTGWLANGTQFDGTAPGGPTASFRIGVGQLIAGWDQGIPGMRVGGRRQLILPPALGYGSQGSGPIPPNAILVFNVEVVSAQ